jgi:hypothetical protein
MPVAERKRKNNIRVTGWKSARERTKLLFLVFPDAEIKFEWENLNT